MVERFRGPHHWRTHQQYREKLEGAENVIPNMYMKVTFFVSHFRKFKCIYLDHIDTYLHHWLFVRNLRKSGMAEDQVIDEILSCFHFSNF